MFSSYYSATNNGGERLILKGNIEDWMKDRNIECRKTKTGEKEYYLNGKLIQIKKLESETVKIIDDYLKIYGKRSCSLNEESIMGKY